MIWAIVSMFISCFKFYVWTYLIYEGRSFLDYLLQRYLFLVKKKKFRWMYWKHERFINKVKRKTNITWLIILAAIGPWPWPSEIVWKCDLVTPNETKQKSPGKEEKESSYNQVDRFEALCQNHVTMTLSLHPHHPWTKLGVEDQIHCGYLAYASYGFNTFRGWEEGDNFGKPRILNK